MAESVRQLVERSAFDAALARARAAEASHHDARLTFNDAKLLRLEILREDLLPILNAAPPGLAAPELSSNLEGEPRLWIDLAAFVEMEPDPRTYRFARDGEAGREVLCESAERAEIAETVRRYIAHRAVAAERRGPAVPAVEASTPSPPASRGGIAVVAAAAFIAGIAAAFVFAIILKLLFIQ